jgi:hypothetical protein
MIVPLPTHPFIALLHMCGACRNADCAKRSSRRGNEGVFTCFFPWFEGVCFGEKEARTKQDKVGQVAAKKPNAVRACLVYVLSKAAGTPNCIAGFMHRCITAMTPLHVSKSKISRLPR